MDHTSIALFAQIPDAFVTAARNTHGVPIAPWSQNISRPSTVWQRRDGRIRPPRAGDYVLNELRPQNKLYTATGSCGRHGASTHQFPASSVNTTGKTGCSNIAKGPGASSPRTSSRRSRPPHRHQERLDLPVQLPQRHGQRNHREPHTGFFANTASNYDIHDLEAYIAQNPSKTFVFWTTSLARNIGTKTRYRDFNAQMRQYASQHGKILIDFADIESHTDTGVPCYDNVTTDGANYPAICRDYTTETVGGHWGSVSAGKILAGKAFWVAMARIAGWNPLTGSGERPRGRVSGKLALAAQDARRRFRHVASRLHHASTRRFRFVDPGRIRCVRLR
ncbi:MAG: hypothetical protein U0263_17475 [Polyangiaceae bacterium]